VSRTRPDGLPDRALQQRYGLLAGVDEVGRGALAGPLTVAAVILDAGRPIPGIDDSKRLSARARQRLAVEVRRHALAWAVVHRSPARIDAVNVLEATREAMRSALLALRPAPDCAVADALALPDLPFPVVSETHADERYVCVAAASILAKVVRDARMARLAGRHPGYGWERNRGYGTQEHLEALRRIGPSPCHRRSFAPVRVSMNRGKSLA
jgi:ribonuclease HII